MAITRRQFVTRLGALAAAAGFSQGQASQIMEALAYNGTGNSPYQGTFGKPRVVWLHGAECTGCSTSLLGIFENAGGKAIEGKPYSTIQALGLAGTVPTNHAPLIGTSNAGGLLLHDTGVSALVGEPAASIDIADVVIDVIDLLYHETVMGMGGDLAYQWLTDFSDHNAKPFVLVVEGALQNKTNGGAWGDSSVPSQAVSWCSVGMNDAGTGEIDMPNMVKKLAEQPTCVAVIAIGQCATFGGYPGCKPPITTASAGFNTAKSQTDALGTYDYLVKWSNAATSAKVINVPGCPTNPWWFVLSVVAFLVDAPVVLAGGVGKVGPLGVLKKIDVTAFGTPARDISAWNATGIAVNGAAVDGTRRLKAVYGNPIHGPYCPRYRDFVNSVYATQPGDPGCLQNLGCKGPASKSLCGVHGWNNQQPQNAGVAGFGTTPVMDLAPDGVTPTGGHCTRAGHPCMACTEKGYPDSFVPFVVRS